MRARTRTGVASLILLLAVSPVLYAYAATDNISGTITWSGIPLVNAKVTAEAPRYWFWGPWYYWTNSGSNGGYSLTVETGVTYTVDAAKETWNHDRKTGITAPNSNVNFALTSRSDTGVDFLIATDDEFRVAYGANWKAKAKAILFGAEPWFWQEHSIFFMDKAYSSAWTSSSSTDCSILLNEAKGQTGWSNGNYQGADILFTITMNDLPAIGCVDFIPTGPNQHPGVLIEHPTSAEEPLVVMHELSHTFGLPHNNDPWYDVMNNDMTLRIKNWHPNNDDTMEARRLWYTG